MNGKVALLMVLEAIVVALIVLFLFDSSKSKEYKKVISTLNDSINILKLDNKLLEKQFSKYNDTIKDYNASIDLLNDSLDNLSRELKKQKQKYGKEIEDIDLVSSDTLYIKFTKWLESR